MGYTFAASGSLPVSRVQGFVISKSTSVSDQRKAKMKDVPAGMRNWESHVTTSDALSGLPHFLLLFTMIFAPNFSITIGLWQVRRLLPWETAPSSALQVFFIL